MRKTFIAGNWKMNLHRAEAIALATSIADQFSDISVEVAVCPPCLYLDAVASCIGDRAVGVGAQNVYYEPSGAYTGEVSSQMLVDIGCRYVIVGHSERRQLMGETSEAVNKKLVAALAAGLVPIVCVGETLDQRESGQTRQVITEQLSGSLAGVTVDNPAKLVVAYEPVWAIGTGKVATPAQAESTHADIRKWLANGYNHEFAEGVRIQYGGSVKPDNAATLLAQPNIDGALVGGASLNADSFLAILASASNLTKPVL